MIVYPYSLQWVNINLLGTEETPSYAGLATKRIVSTTVSNTVIAGALIFYFPLEWAESCAHIAFHFGRTEKVLRKFLLERALLFLKFFFSLFFFFSGVL